MDECTNKELHIKQQLCATKFNKAKHKALLREKVLNFTVHVRACEFTMEGMD